MLVTSPSNREKQKQKSQNPVGPSSLSAIKIISSINQSENGSGFRFDQTHKKPRNTLT